jgi:hypothetical protein
MNAFMCRLSWKYNFTILFMFRGIVLRWCKDSDDVVDYNYIQ